jgi:hypothetical protein
METTTEIPPSRVEIVISCLFSYHIAVFLIYRTRYIEEPLKNMKFFFPPKGLVTYKTKLLGSYFSEFVEDTLRALISSLFIILQELVGQ